MKKFSIIILIILLVVCATTLVGCTNNSFGKEFKSMNELSEFLKANNIPTKLPQYITDSDKIEAKLHYIAKFDKKKDAYDGYKIYCFSEPFHVGIYGYNFTSDTIISDDPTRAKEHSTVTINDINIQIFTGENTGDGIFLIAKFNQNNEHYEIRIVGRGKKKNSPTYDITFDSELFNKATVEIEKIAKDIIIA